MIGRVPAQIRQMIERYFSRDERPIPLHERLPERGGVLGRRGRSEKQNKNNMTHRSSI